MEKFVPYGKMSKKRQREIDRAKRNSWGNVNPATKSVKSAKAYDRKKLRSQDRKSLSNGVNFLFFVFE